MRKRNLGFVTAGIIYVIGSFCAQGLKFITLPVFSRLMSPEDYGYISSYELWISIITIFIGLQTAATIANAYIDFGKEQIDKYTSSVATIGTGSLIIMVLITILCKKVISNLFELPFWVLILGVGQCYFAYMILMICGKYRILEKPIHYIAFTISNSVIGIGLSISIVYVSSMDEYLGYISGSLISNFIIGTIAIVSIYITGKNIFDKKMTKYAIRLSSPLILHSLSSIVLARVNQIMLLKMISATEAGLYNFGNNFAFIVNALYTAFNQAYIPWYYKKLSQNKVEEVKSMSEKYMSIFTMIVGILILSMPEIIELMSTPDYYSVKKIVPIVLLGMYLNFLYTFAVNYEMYKKETKYVAIGTIIAMFFNISMNFILIDKYNIYGAAIATVGSMLLLCVMHFYFAKIKIGNFELGIKIYMNNLFKLVFFIGVYYFSMDIIFIRYIVIVIIVGYMSYIICSYYIKYINKE